MSKTPLTPALVPAEETAAKVYISGPMTNIPDLNYPAFFCAEAWVEMRGLRFVNPARLNPPGRPWAECLKTDIRALLDCNEILLLEGWEGSKGACAELWIARLFKMNVWKFVEVDGSYQALPLEMAEALNPVVVEKPHGEETVCQEADRIVSSDRGNDYGHPFDDFSKTGRIWGPILQAWAKDPAAPVPPEAVALCMVGVKISREVNKKKRDNLVDGIGYFKCLDMVKERRAEMEVA